MWKAAWRTPFFLPRRAADLKSSVGLVDDRTVTFVVAASPSLRGMTGLPRHLLRKNIGGLNLFCLAWFG
jgi:hypothetical protein